MSDDHEDVMRKFCGIIVLGCALTGCGTVTEQVYLQGLDATANVPSPPLFITDSVHAGLVQFSPKIVGLTGSDGVMTGSIQIDGPRFPDTVYKYRSPNFKWAMPKVGLGLDAQVAVTQSLSLTGGVVSGGVGGSNFVDWSVGMGLTGTGQGQGVAVRVDAGVHGQSSHVVAPSVAVIRTEPLFGEPTQSVYYFVDETNTSSLGWYAALTFNSRAQDWPVNFFLQGGYNDCTLASFEPKHMVFPLILGTYEYQDTRADYRVSVWSVAPGVYFRVTGGIRLLAGARWVSADVSNASGSSFWMPFLQLDLIPQ